VVVVVAVVVLVVDGAAVSVCRVIVDPLPVELSVDVVPGPGVNVDPDEIVAVEEVAGNSVVLGGAAVAAVANVLVRQGNVTHIASIATASPGMTCIEEIIRGLTAELVSKLKDSWVQSVLTSP
jgi:hypothetical protein